MKVRLSFLLGVGSLLGVLSCERDYRGAPQLSPSGTYYLVTSINRSDEAGADQHELIVHLLNAAQKELGVLKTGVMDTTQWHVGWAGADTILLWTYHSDRAWEVRNGVTLEVAMTSQLEERADWMKGP